MREPRVYQSTSDIPEGVVVGIDLDKAFPSYYKWVDGVRYMDWRRDDDGHIWWDDGETTPGDWLEEFGPFTEVVGAV
jgi:hypothetical protein